MRIPYLKIHWKEFSKIPTDIYVHKIANGFLVGDTYFSTEEEMFEQLKIWIKEPYGNIEPPTYTKD